MVRTHGRWLMFRRFIVLITLTCLTHFQGVSAQQIDRSVTIVGGGIVGLLEAYYSHLEAKEVGETVQITILEKNAKLSDTTVYNIVPSLTPDEIMSVVPRGADLVTFLKQKFNEGNGIRVDDVAGIDESSEVVARFIRSVERYGKDEEGHRVRSETLLDLGKYCMDLWQDFYEGADEELQEILRDSNYKPCLEVDGEERELHRGYRIDLIFNDQEAKRKAESMQASYHSLGYLSSRILSPSEVMAIDPQLRDFARANSFLDADGDRHWQEDAVALWRPGGCINAAQFLPKFIAYLEKTVVDSTYDGEELPLFAIKYDSEVVGVEYDHSRHLSRVKVRNSKGKESFFPNIEKKKAKEFIFAPGEAVGTLRKLGFAEPDYAIFAGPSLRFSIDIPKELMERYQNLDHCMEVHQEGVVLAWQAKYSNAKVYIGVAGTKAFYGDKLPQLHEEFARDRHLLQLNIVNNVYWDLISLALGKDSVGKTLGQEDLDSLIDKGIAKVWVGSRAVAYDGFPTLGSLYKGSKRVRNARVTTHLGSGGGSFAIGAIAMSRAIAEKEGKATTPLASKIAQFADSRR